MALQTQTSLNRGWPKGAIKNKRTGKMLTNSKGDPILKGTAAAARAGYGASYFNKVNAQTKSRPRSQTANRATSRAGTGTRTQAKRNTTMRGSRSA